MIKKKLRFNQEECIFTAFSWTVLVCVGDDVSLTCKTNSTALEWRVSVGNVDTRVGTQYITSTSLANVTDFVTSVGVFKFSRTSLMSPLVSVLHIENITSGLNGTRVQCSSFSDSVVLNSTIINVSEYGKFQQRKFINYSCIIIKL